MRSVVERRVASCCHLSEILFQLLFIKLGKYTVNPLQLLLSALRVSTAPKATRPSTRPYVLSYPIFVIRGEV